MHASLSILLCFSDGVLLFFGFVLVSYLTALFFLRHKWRGLNGSIRGGFVAIDFTVVIPFRNERKHLPRLLKNLKEVGCQGEVIFVDDESGDGSYEYCTEFITKNKPAVWRCIKSRGKGKKAALDTGITACRTEIVVTTDADVIIPANWPENLLWPFSKESVKMVAGPVISVKGRGFFGAFEQIEWGSILLVTGAAFALQKPIMCSGANLAFRKSAFLEVGGYKGNEQYLSGDDEFLLKKIVRYYGKKASVFNKSASALVFTFALNRPSDWINQRARWASKWRLHRSLGHAFAAIVIFVYSMAHIGSFMFVIAKPSLWLFFSMYWSAKIIVESMVIGEVLMYYGKRRRMGDYMVAGFLHPVMVFFTVFPAIFGKFKWKGRNNTAKH